MKKVEVMPSPQQWPFAHCSPVLLQHFFFRFVSLESAPDEEQGKMHPLLYIIAILY